MAMGNSRFAACSAFAIGLGTAVGALPAAAAHGLEIRGVPALPTRAAGVAAVLEVARTGPLTAQLAFDELAGGTRIRAYDVDMTKRMHVIIVGDDLRTFLHVHPAQDRDGTFRIAVTVPAPGRYHIYADAEPHGYGQRVFRFDVPFGSGEMRRDVRRLQGVRAVRAGRYEVRLDRTTIPAGKEAMLNISITADGRAPRDLHPYLGGLAHAVFVNVLDLSYLHVHPTAPGAMRGMSGMHEGDVSGGMSSMDDAMTMNDLPDTAHVSSPMQLAVVLPHAGIYVLWFQFRGGDAIHIARFVVTASV